MGSPEDLRRALLGLKQEMETEHLRYVELRPLTTSLDTQQGFDRSKTFWIHKIDLRPALDELFRGLHNDCVQRKISRAMRESLSYEDGTSANLLRKFYHLVGLTRRRQNSVPQPIAWFRNLVDCQVSGLKISIASKDGQPIAGMMTLRYKDVLVYKYGCSDWQYKQLGATQGLFWRTIQNAKASGLATFDLGRSDLNNPGLITFKDRWGSSRREVTYWRYPALHNASWPRGSGLLKAVAGHMPRGVLTMAGRLLYKHVG